MIYESSWDDGEKNDLRLADLLVKYDVPATFYVPCEPVKKLYQALFLAEEYPQLDWGAHTISHPMDLKALTMTPDDMDFLKFEVVTSGDLLAAATGAEVRSFCYPRGRYNDVVKFWVKQRYDEARTTEVMRIDSNWDKYEKPTTIHVFQRKEYGSKAWDEVARDLFMQALKTDGGYFHIWGHSNEIERDKNWEKLEEFFKWVNKQMSL